LKLELFIILGLGCSVGYLMLKNYHQGLKGLKLSHLSYRSYLSWPDPKLVKLLVKSVKNVILQKPNDVMSRPKDLEQELSNWQQILQNCPSAYIQVNDENCLAFCNYQACKLLGIQDCEADRKKLLLQLVRSYELDN